MIDDKKLETLYACYLGITDKMVEEFGAMAVAGVMMAQALSIYKTALNEDEFNMIVDRVSQSRNDVKTFSNPVTH